METQKSNYFVRHWRGELPLSVSFWGNVVFVNIVVTFLSNVVTMGGFVDGVRWQSLLLLSFSLVTFAIVVGLWQIVGTWRSAKRYRQGGGSKIGAGIVQLLMAIGLLSMISNIVIVAQDHLKRYESMQAESFEVYLSDDRETLFIDGVIGVTISDEVLALLEENGTITRLSLNSYGGDLNETFRILNAFAEYRKDGRQLTTYARGYCASACSILFVSGDHRVLAEGAQLGFHKLQAYVAVDADNIERLQEKVAHYFLRQGVSRNFIGEMYQAEPDDMWHPDVETLLAANVVHQIAPPDAGSGSAATATSSAPDVMGLIRRTAPERYKAFEQRLAALPQGENYTQNVELATENFVSELKLEAIRRLDDDLLLQVIGNETVMYSTLAENDPALCMQTLYPNAYGFPEYVSVMSYQDEAAFARELTQIFEQGLTRDFTEIDYDAAQRDLDVVLNSMPGDVEALSNYDESIDGYRQHCQAIADFYAHIGDALHEKNAANLIRWLLEPE